MGSRWPTGGVFKYVSSDTSHAEAFPVATPRGRSVSFPTRGTMVTYVTWDDSLEVFPWAQRIFVSITSVSYRKTKAWLEVIHQENCAGHAVPQKREWWSHNYHGLKCNKQQHQCHKCSCECMCNENVALALMHCRQHHKMIKCISAMLKSNFQDITATSRNSPSVEMKGKSFFCMAHIKAVY